MLERVGVDAYKIASGDLTWDQLIVRARARPASRSSSRPAWRRSPRCTTRSPWRAWPGAEHVALLHCVSAYPVPQGQREPAGHPHAGATSAACRSACPTTAKTRSRCRWPSALGASLYERHLVLRRRRRGRSTVRCRARRPSWPPRFGRGRRAWSALGIGPQGLPGGRGGQRRRQPPLAVRRRATCRRGTSSTADDLVALRPATGPAAVALCRSCWAAACTRPLAPVEPDHGRACRRAARCRRRTVSLNVLITAGSRRVPLVQAFQRALRATGGGAVIVTDVNPLSPAVYVADRSYRGAAVDRAGLRRRDPARHLPTPSASACVVPTIDDELTRCSRRSAAIRSPRASAWPCRRPRRRAPATTSTRPAACSSARGLRGRRDVAARRRCPPTRAVPAVHQAARRARRRRAPSRSATQRELDFFLDYVRRPGRAGVPRRAGVHDRRAVRLRRAVRSRSCRASAW